MNKYFGTDGFRGQFGTTLLPSHAYYLGRFLGEIAKSNNNQIVLATDTRQSGKQLSHAAICGITSKGTNVTNLGVSTTPSVAYYCKQNQTYGLVITASHNPHTDNGLKLFTPKGEKANQTLIDQIEAYYQKYLTPKNIAKTQFKMGKGKEQHKQPTEYVQSIKDQIKNISTKGVVIDCANGAASALAKQIFPEAAIICCNPNGTNINNNCGSTHINNLAQATKTLKATIGFAFDGDADRCLCVDSKGNIINGDSILYLVAKTTQPKVVVGTIMTNEGLAESLNKIGIQLLRSDVGDSNVWQQMQKFNSPLGGETSGHIIFKNLATTGDGMLTAAMVLKTLNGQKPAKLLKSCVLFPSCELAIKTPHKNQITSQIAPTIKNLNQTLLGSGRALVRASGTEEKVRVLVEAKTQKQAVQLATKLQIELQLISDQQN